LKNLITGKVGFIFSNETVFDLKPVIESSKVETSAKVGGTAPIDVVIPPGPTGMDPSQISFFHALQVPTKIEKG
jgi:large subunit ribosomal protein LP0